MDAAISELFKILKPGGSVYLVSESPYGEIFKTFIPEYEKRKLDNTINWPGYIENLKTHMDEYSEDNPNTMLLLGDVELRRGFKKAGFKVNQCAFFSRKGIFPDRLCRDDRESVGIIASKPVPL